MDEYIIKVRKVGERWYADMYTSGTNRLIANGVGKMGPLDAASNAAINASNKEYSELQDAGA